MLQPKIKQTNAVNPYLELLNPYLLSLIPTLHSPLAPSILLAWKRELPSFVCSKQQQNWNYHVICINPSAAGHSSGTRSTVPVLLQWMKPQGLEFRG